MLNALVIACSACSLTGGDNQEAYIWMTVMLCLVPCFAIGGVVLWVRAEARAQEKAQE